MTPTDTTTHGSESPARTGIDGTSHDGPQHGGGAAMPPPRVHTASAGAPKRSGLPLRSYLAIGATSALAAGLVVLPTQLGQDRAADLPQGGTAASAPAEPQVDTEPLASGGDLVAAVADRVSPSVVRIDVRGPQGQGSGSGVVLDADGNILTNAHVVGSASQVSVLAPDGQRLDADVVGADPGSDIAVINVDAELPVPTFATAEPSGGATAVAIGSPFGLDGSVTSGVVSAVGRTIPGDNAPLIDMVQTDAAINPGNSGGALVDAEGRVMGINTAILSPSGANDGVGFAVPIATALDIAEQLNTTGEVTSGWLGIEGQTVDPQVAELYGLQTTTGAILAAVLPDSPAAQAGLQEGDVVVSIDGEPVESMLDLAGRVRRVQPGETATLTILRDGSEQDVEVTLGDRPENLQR